MLNTLGIEVKRLDLPYTLNHVNTFIAEGESGYILIDTGIHDTRTLNVWEEEFADKQLEKIILSHYHPDHTGCAGVLQKKYNAELYMTEVDIEMSRIVWSDAGISELQRQYKLAGVATNQSEQLINNFKEYLPHVTPVPTKINVLEIERPIQFGNFQYDIIETPGHSPGLITLYNKEKNVLIGTDHLLGKITPNISYWYRMNKNPLKEFFNSLYKIEKLNVEYVIPSHGSPFYDANKRIEEIISHHKIRLEQTLDSIKQGGTVLSSCEALFKDKNLDVHAMRSALGETFSHLEFLFKENVCKKEERNGSWFYYI